jgi:tripartite-type tricarboxylate transporter receptor subunit TctC
MHVTRAKPDGYTLLVGGRNLTTNEALYPDLQYSPSKDLKPIMMMTNASVLLVVNPSLPVKTLRELVEHLKRHPGTLNYASYGAGSTPHLAAEVFQRKTGTKITHVPYKGNGPAVVAMLGNETQILFTTATSVATHLKEGRLKALAIDGATRAATYPQLPTFRESGIDFTVGSWFGLLAPANTPDNVIARIHDAARQALNEPATRDRLASQGWDVVADSPQEFGKFLKDETALLSGIIKAAGIRLD